MSGDSNPAASGAAPADTRALFERWFSDEGRHPHAIKRGYGDFYASETTQELWFAWKACADTLASREASPAPLTDEQWAGIEEFSEGQWWIRELDAMVKDGTDNQKRAVIGVVRRMMCEHAAMRAALASPQVAPALSLSTPLESECRTISGFLSDVMTAAGLVEHGKKCKALAERLSKACMEMRALAALAPVAPTPDLSTLTDEQIADAIECEFSETHEWPEGDAATFRAILKHAQVAPTPAQASQWQPIETAPQRGIVLLGLAPNEEHEDGYVSPGYWRESDDDGPDNMGHDAGFVDVHFDFFTCARSIGNPAYQHKGLQPTHWMPLPPAPGQVAPQDDARDAADTKRLNWLDEANQRLKIGWRVSVAPAGNVSVGGVIQLSGKATTIREAIDAVMPRPAAKPTEEQP